MFFFVFEAFSIFDDELFPIEFKWYLQPISFQFLVQNQKNNKVESKQNIQIHILFQDKSQL